MSKFVSDLLGATRKSGPGRSRMARGLVVALAGMLAVAGCSADQTSGQGDQSKAPNSVQAEPGIGVFYVNGVQRVSDYSDNRDSDGKFPTKGLTTVYDQAKITYLIPEKPTGPNIVLVPGYGLPADIYMTTPDRRQSWAQMLYRAGYPVYLLSPPDRGESMPVDQINKCLAGKAPKKDCTGTNKESYYGQLGHATLEDGWPTWRFGEKYPQPYPDSQFPSLPLKENYVEQFGSSLVPYLGSSVGIADSKFMRDLIADSIKSLLDEIGPSVVLLHSAAGTGGYQVASQDPSLVKAVVAIETTKCPDNLPDGQSPMANTPFLGIWGDHITKDSPGGHLARRQSCEQMADAINKSGHAPAEVISLPDTLNIHGNSHMMMQDRNNEQIEEIIVEWLKSHNI